MHEIEAKFSHFNGGSFSSKKNKKKKIEYNASLFVQVFWLTWRQIRNQMRENFATRLLALQSVVSLEFFYIYFYINHLIKENLIYSIFLSLNLKVIGLFLGFTYYQLNNDQSSIQNKNGLLFTVIMHVSLACK